MEYPLQLELDISQDDYVAVEILEQALDADLWKKSVLKTFVIETVVIIAAVIGMMVMISKGIFVVQAIIFPVFFWVMFLLHFLYTYFFGVKREFNMAVKHLLESKDTHTFFTPERGMLFMFEDRAEYLTNEQRRYFDYDKVQNIKEIRHMFIFVMKRSKEKNLRGFAYMIIPKRNLVGDQEDRVREICNNIIEKYDLKEWTDSRILG